MLYKYKPGSRLKGDPYQVGNRLAALEAEHGELTPELVERDARKKSSPLHDLFEWDDSEAAYRYRLGQAAHVIRCVVVIDEPTAPEAHVAYLRVDVASDEEVGEDEEPAPKRSSYRSATTVMSDAQLRQQVLERALHELKAFQRKYRDLVELAEVFAAIERALAVEELVSA